MNALKCSTKLRVCETQTHSLRLFEALLQQMKLLRLRPTRSGTRISCFKAGGVNNRAYLIASRTHLLGLHVSIALLSEPWVSS